MAERTYNQFCSVAKALDLVGERWSLLIVRELILGPRRFTDLQTALPGIGTSMLASRLKHLETAGVATKRVLPPPAATTAYELTASGWRLALVVRALADWGLHLLTSPQPGETVSADWLALYVTAGKQPAIPKKRHETYELRVGGSTAHIVVAGGQAVPRSGPAPVAADVVFTGPAESFVDAAAGRAALTELVATGAITTDAAPAAVARAAEIFGN